MQNFKQSLLQRKCSTLIQRLQKDVEQQIRTSDVINRSLLRFPLYQNLNTVKIDVSNTTPSEVAEAIKGQFIL